MKTKTRPRRRRLPIYLLVDCSESMLGLPLAVMKESFELLGDWSSWDTSAIGSPWLSIITLGTGAQQISPLKPMMQYIPLRFPLQFSSSLGAGIDLLSECLANEIEEQTTTTQGDWPPIAYLLTDGWATDDWRSSVTRFRSHPANESVTLVAVALGRDVNLGILKEITPNVLHCKDSPRIFAGIFRWLATSISSACGILTRTSEALALPGSGVEVADPEGERGEVANRPSQILIGARCPHTGRGFLMRYRWSRERPVFLSEESFPVEVAYLRDSSQNALGGHVDVAKLDNAPGCPHCGNTDWMLIDSDQLAICCSRRSEGQKPRFIPIRIG